MSLFSSTNYTLQDVLGSLLAFVLFSLVFVFPGYVIGQSLDLLDFRARRRPVRYVFALVFSNAILPIFLFLAYRLASAWAGLILLFGFGVSWAILEARALLRERSKPTREPSPALRHYELIALGIAAGWVLFVVLFLVDMQIGQRLYFNINAYDFTTRVSIVDAMTRTGVPPVSPGYYPGEPNYINQLYYFWYILASAVDALGGRLVMARQAMIASVAWCGLVLMATLATYLRVRNSGRGTQAWISGLVGITLLAISGLDAVPALTSMISTRLEAGLILPAGDIEGWNEQITAWIGAVAWVPHHLAGALACLTGLLVMLAAFDRDRKHKLIAALVCGLAFASAVGLSTWVGLTFAVFCCAWSVALLFDNRRRQMVSFILLAGLVATIAVSPFLMGLLRGGSDTVGFPITFEVRRFGSLVGLVNSLPGWLQQVVFLISLPLNYFLELGFFMIAGLFWLQQNARRELRQTPFALAEIVLLAVVLLVATFMRSTSAGGNDLGWRSWLLGQFVLLVWAVETLHQLRARTRPDTHISLSSHREILKTTRLLAVLAAIGICTSLLDVALLRTSPMLLDAGITGYPNGTSSDAHIGERTYNARLAYDYIRGNIPAEILIQSNPLVQIDRAGGLYGDHQMAAAGRTAYGVSRADFLALVASIQPIFTSRYLTWDRIDQICSAHQIGVVVLNDQDPRWGSLDALVDQRPPLYSNDYYAVFACGEYASHPPQLARP